jgi:hypothetical protein
LQAYAIGSCHLDIAAVRTAEGMRSLCVASDRSCTCADAERHEEANQLIAAQFRRHVMAARPDKIHTVRTDHGLQCTNRKRDR